MKYLPNTVTLKKRQKPSAFMTGVSLAFGWAPVTNIRDALENHEENKSKDLSSTICEYVSLECTPQVRYRSLHFENFAHKFNSLLRSWRLQFGVRANEQ